mmetsp:Transcript_74503/g.148080  ORF Transcript_74503/g.148080 Transcript_74503/m.148080 type:complete len:403 (-) Transcript_74503:370-1578(-)
MKPLFVAATRQHVGKTTVSLALMSGLQKRFDRVGFIKPVGQQHIAVNDEEGRDIRVDKDCQVMKEYFALDHVSYADMSPVIIPRGYTSEYIEGRVTNAKQVKAIKHSYAKIAALSNIVLVEGTGHVGVGSVVEVSNARAAAMLGAEVVLVANGGLGRAFDELEMNRTMFAQEGVPVRGVVLNKVLPDKVEMVRDKMSRLLMDRWGVPLLGVVPDMAYLGRPTLANLCSALQGELLAGERCARLHYGVDDAFLITTGLRRFLRRAFEQREKVWRRPLFVTHATRDDLLLGFLAHHQRVRAQLGDISPQASDWAGAMVLSTGASKAFPDLQEHMDDIEPLSYLVDMAKQVDAPVIITSLGTIDALEAIKKYTAKHNINDTSRVQAAIDHYEPQIDFDTLLSTTG